MTRIVSQGGRNNWRTHVPRRPVTLQPDKSEARFLIYGALVALALILWSIA